ncbi:MAG: hypothetical protein ACQETO_04035 [Pseudomonadota bacterium]
MNLSHGNTTARTVLPAILVLLYLGSQSALAADTPDPIHRINGSIEFSADDTPGTALQTVNGGVRIRSGSEAGDISTVNGPIRIESQSMAGAAQTVNGTISVDADADVAGTVQAVNGGITIEPGSRIGGDVATVNGLIRIDDAHIGGSVRTVNGNVLVRAGSVIEGDIRFSEAQAENGWLPRLFGFGNGAQRSRLDVGADVTVEGDIHLYREVELHIDDSARIGEIIRHY